MRHIFIITSGGQLSPEDCAKLRRFIANKMRAETPDIEYKISETNWLNDIIPPDGCDLVINPQGHIAYYDAPQNAAGLESAQTLAKP